VRSQVRGSAPSGRRWGRRCCSAVLAFLSFTVISVFLFQLFHLLVKGIWFGFRFGESAVCRMMIRKLSAFGAVFPGEGWLGRLSGGWVLVSGPGGAELCCCFCFWDGFALSDSCGGQAFSFRFPSPEFDPTGRKSRHRNGSLIGSVFLCLRMP